MGEPGKATSSHVMPLLLLNNLPSGCMGSRPRPALRVIDFLRALPFLVVLVAMMVVAMEEEALGLCVLAHSVILHGRITTRCRITSEVNYSAS